jgi:hypothetical protein|tara:strand:- start:227 stop:451 length:225 start_codon:yes stop_codon:yes gene_type:complete
MKLIKKHNTASIYIERTPGSNAKFYAKINDVMLDTPFDSQSLAEQFIDGTDDSTTSEQDVRVIDSGYVQARAPK